MKRVVTLAFLALAGFLAVYAFMGAPALGTGGAASARALPQEMAAAELSDAGSDTGAYFLDIRLWDLLGLLTILAVALAARRALAPPGTGEQASAGAGSSRDALRLAAAGVSVVAGLGLAAWNVFGSGSVIAGGGFIGAALTGYSLSGGGTRLVRVLGEKARMTAEALGFVLVMAIGGAGAAGRGFLSPGSTATLVLLALGLSISVGFILYGMATAGAAGEAA